MAFAALIAVLPIAAPLASAEPIDPNTADESISIWVRQLQTKEPVPNLSVEVKGDDFDETFTTDAEGRIQVGLPGPGTYTVTVDDSTAPDGVGTLPDAQNPREVSVQATNKGVPANFLFTTADTGSGGATSPSDSASPSSGASDSGSSSGPRGITGGLVASKIVTGIIYGLLLALASIGVSLIYGTTGLNNFAHGELVTFGALMGYLFSSILGLPGVVGILAAVILGGVYGFAQDVVLWKPLRKRGVGLVPLMIVSIGLALATRYIYSFIFGADRLTLPNDPSPFLKIGSVSLRFTDVMGAVVALVVLLLVAFVMLRTRLGKAARAVADNRSLAAASGIDVDFVIRCIWIGGAALAGLSGVLIAYYQSLRWDTGSQILLLIFAAVTLGGLGSAFGALVGSLVISVFMNLSTLFIPDNLKYVAALAVMIVILLVRPQGILGRRERIG
ncbi:branched-chain amino acid ABC transporter permease [Schumannella sp. 10F1B-5-1]|uniref:branched-chain amino acid ABC transporter permease n=1 Tax=Schumannella sp. 10F1B-5-1 TaxID=2590780 RepID=UPI0011318A3A|nr:branched-chain amino acid ABC transporter permease [Schumannella sp. 10F1B-5-1]TPW71782.1 branched-chain amino acid ABC transporter permease [Schumannella sp. 10F1B-5-1]